MLNICKTDLIHESVEKVIIAASDNGMDHKQYKYLKVKADGYTSTDVS